MGIALVIGAGSSCTSIEDKPKEECSEALERRQMALVRKAVGDTDFIADQIEGALDIQTEGGLTEGQERTLRRAQARARELSGQLDQAFNTDCI